MTSTAATVSPVASINGVALHAAGDALPPAALRQRACTELLRQAAQAAGLLAADDAPAADGVISAAASAAIEALLERNISLPAPADEACRRYYEAHKGTYRTGERLRARHILFAVTPGVDVVALRKQDGAKAGEAGSAHIVLFPGRPELFRNAQSSTPSIHCDP